MILISDPEYAIALKNIIHEATCIILGDDPLFRLIIAEYQFGIVFLNLVPGAYAVAHALVPLSFVDFFGIAPGPLALALRPALVVFSIICVSILEPLIASSLSFVFDPEALIDPTAGVKHHTYAVSHLSVVNVLDLAPVDGIGEPDDLTRLLSEGRTQSKFRKQWIIVHEVTEMLTVAPLFFNINSLLKEEWVLADNVWILYLQSLL